MFGRFNLANVTAPRVVTWIAAQNARKFRFEPFMCGTHLKTALASMAVAVEAVRPKPKFAQKLKAVPCAESPMGTLCKVV